MKRILVTALDENDKIQIREKLGDEFEVVFVDSHVGSLLQSEKIRIDLSTQEAFAGESVLDLTGIEFRLLGHFLRNEDRNLSRDELLTSVWGENVYVLGRTIDKHICTLRKKLGAHGKRIATIEGVGYRFVSTRQPGPSKAA